MLIDIPQSALMDIVRANESLINISQNEYNGNFWVRTEKSDA